MNKVGATMVRLSIEALLEPTGNALMDLRNLAALYELRRKCQDDSYQMFSPALRKVLSDAGFCDPLGNVHREIADIVLTIEWPGGCPLPPDPGSPEF